ncbi:hypothetical protein AV530_011989 [Patagioenas fasciata monilis]|uniref:Uncharacterized protein n=1 Tax=Patagioenas fasciata monilis TaxID=372326 RepID=A0A1V4JUJ2_PATFA|nr:hypothetical protein AV530_011989 [Patagioenas fasciata monilis]
MFSDLIRLDLGGIENPTGVILCENEKLLVCHPILARLEETHPSSKTLLIILTVVPWAAMQDSFTSRLSEIRHITELMPLAPKGREEVNHNIPLLGNISGGELWAQYCVNTTSRFTGLADHQCGNPCACSILPSVDIAENLRAVCKAGDVISADAELTLIGFKDIVLEEWI